MNQSRGSAHDLPPPLSAQRLLDDTLAVPRSVQASFDGLVESVDRTLAGTDVLGIDAFVLGGSGDLYHSALATELAFERLTGVPSRALTSMALGLYRARSLTPRSVVIQMSFSGKTARAVEAASLARAAGARIWALSSDSASALAEIGERCLVKPDTGRNEAAGYPITMLLLYLVAIKVGELRHRLRETEASALRTQLAGAYTDMQHTLDQCMSPARALADRFVDINHALFLSSGPAFASAANSSARMFEAVGLNSAAQDIEEWVHLDRWVEETASPSFVIAPAGPSRDRAAEVLGAMKTLGKPAVAIVPDRDADLGRVASAWLPVRCGLPEEFSPLVYSLPGELFAHLLGVARGSHPYRSDIAAYHRLGEIRWGGALRKSLPARSLPRAEPGLEPPARS